jgi:uncharacterized repeat protein (TIGR03803 family)
MRSLGLDYYALCLGVAFALLAGCGALPFDAAQGRPAQDDTRPPIGTPSSYQYQVLHDFAGGSDGAGPAAGLVNMKGILYGTTFFGGGTYDNGSVFSITTAGAENVLYRFGPDNSPNGDSPETGLIDVNGKLYGTTSYGGKHYGGTAFNVTTTGEEHVLYSFKETYYNVILPSSLIDVNGTFYGTTYQGGLRECSEASNGGGCGTVFSITSDGQERVLHEFKGGSDGAFPLAGLTLLNGSLYGTTTRGGKGRYCDGGGCGTVFSITTAGKEHVLHSFDGGKDGISPEASLIGVNGTLYGTTNSGGEGCADSNLCGTVFSISTSGKEKVLHSFGGTSEYDGKTPIASLIDVNGTLYGTTWAGGSYASGSPSPGGTVFSVTTAGAEHILHSFGSGSDGANPSASLIEVNGTLYGTTQNGGTYSEGTVFALSP